MGRNAKGLRNLPPPLGRPIRTSHPLAQGLVMACPFSEPGGLICRDVVKGLKGTHSATPTMTSKGMATTSNADRVTFPVGFPKNVGDTNVSPFSVSLWINRDNITNTNTLFGWSFTGDGDTGWYCQINAIGVGILNFDYYAGASYIRCITSSQLTPGVWYHMVCTRDNQNAVYPASTQKIYINGINVGTTANAGFGAPQTVSLTNKTFGIAARGPLGTIFQGKTTNFAMWNRTLSDTEIRQLYINPYCIYK